MNKLEYEENLHNIRVNNFTQSLDVTPDPMSFHERVLPLVACPKCHGALSFATRDAKCLSCDFEMRVRDGVILAREQESGSYFDDVYEVMRVGNRAPGTWEIFYRQQAEAVERTLSDGEVVVDVGCGPELPYRKNGAFVIGVDASFHSIRANSMADLRVFGSAAALPLRNAVADAIVCFYSIHHMTGQSVIEHREIVRKVFREFARALKPGRRLMIFDVSPRWPFGAIEELVWNAARRRLGQSLDMFFWKARDLEMLGREMFPKARFSIKRFNGSPLQTFPPIFSKPSFRVPRFLYPFDVNLYTWQLDGENKAS